MTAQPLHSLGRGENTTPVMLIVRSIRRIKMILSPLSGVEATILEEHSSSEFIQAWKDQLSIDVTDEFNGIDVFYKCLCPLSQYEFFFPFELEGTAKLYEQLLKQNWYYASNKWEYRSAIQQMEKSSVVNKELLEVGCGRGSFLTICDRWNKDINSLGIELNQKAVGYAKKDGLNVHAINLSELEQKMPSHFGVILSFQVLEHVADPLTFIRSCVNLLEPNGSLIISTPDGHGFCGRMPSRMNILDSPPHHMGKWNISTFQYLTKILPIRLNTILYEPLQNYHLHRYIRDMLSCRIKKEKKMQQISRKILSKLLAYYVSAFNIYPHWKGHTLLVRFTKLT